MDIQIYAHIVSGVSRVAFGICSRVALWMRAPTLLRHPSMKTRRRRPCYPTSSRKGTENQVRL